MIDYKQILLQQKIIKHRAEQQTNNMIWSAPFIVLDDVLKDVNDVYKWDNIIFKKDNNGIFFVKNQEEIRITTGNQFFLYNLPFHFGIQPLEHNKEKGEYFLDKNVKINKVTEYPTTTIYKNSKRIVGAGLNEQDYIYFTHFANKNYFTYRKDINSNQIDFKYDLFYEDKETINEDIFTTQGPYFIERYINPSYVFQGIPDTDHKIQLINICNSSCQIKVGEIDKKNIYSYPCFFSNMPLQEQEYLSITEDQKEHFYPVIGETFRGQTKMYYTKSQGASRSDYIEYYTDINTELRLY